jgi:hypothetical protein
MPQQASGQKISRAMKIQQALELRRDGLGFFEIGRKMGLSKSQVHRLVLAGLAELNKTLKETADEVRRLSLERLDFAAAAAISRISTKKDMNAVQKLVLVEERRARLLGLDAPLKTAQTTPDGDALPPALDLSKLTDEQLAALDAIYAAGAPQPTTRLDEV